MAAPASADATASPYSIVQTHDPASRPRRHQQPSVSAHDDHAAQRIMDYHSTDRRPPADWLARRHRDLPAIFRDSFGHTH